MIEVPVQVKDALREGRYKKTYRFQVLNDDGTVDFIIDNNNLVSESVSIDERMCTGDTLKFGLCEGSSLEFQYFGKPNITGRRIQAFIDVDYLATEVTLTETESVFTVTAGGAYNILVPAGSPSFEIEIETDHGWPAPSIEVSSMNMDQTFPINCAEGYVLTVVSSSPVTIVVKKADNIGFPLLHTIPMGYFTVKKCSRQASTGIIKVMAYNKLQSDYLDSEANQVLIEARESYDTHCVKFDAITLDAIINQALSDYEIIDYKTDVQMGIPSYITQTIGAGFATDLRLYNSDHTSTSQYLHTRQSIILIGVMDESLLQYTTELGDSFWYLPGFWKMQIETSQFETAYRSFLIEQVTALGLTNYLVRYDSDYMSIVDYYMKLVFDPYEATTSYHPAYVRLNTYSSNYPWEQYGLNSVMSPVISPMIGPPHAAGKQLGSFQSLPLAFKYDSMSTTNWSTAENQAAFDKGVELLENITFTLYKQNESGIGSMIVSEADLEAFPNVTLRELQSATFEVDCQYGQLSRKTDLFSGVELNHSQLLPADALYPSDSLYPNGASESAFRSQYSKLWADEGNIRKWRYLIITYKGLDENQQEKEFTLQRTVNADGTDDYNMSDNWLFRNLVWTASDIGDYADAMVLKMQNITWFPFEMWCAGLPYLEVGDEIEIPLGTQTYTSYILQRQLKGIQNLQDTYINGTLDIF